MSADSLRNRDGNRGLAWMLWPVRILSLAAVAIAGYLFWAHTSGAPIAGCDPMSGLDCSAALSSRWGQWFGIPVLWIGAACYGVIFLASWGLARQSKGISATAWRLFVAAVIVAAGAGFWFLGLQLVGQSSICPYCIGIHGCGLMIATIVGVYLLSNRMSERCQPAAASLVGLRSTLGPRAAPPVLAGSRASMPSLILSYAGAILALAALVGGQIFFVPPQYHVLVGELDKPVDLDASPSLAKPDSPSGSAADKGTPPTNASDSRGPDEQGDPVAEKNRHAVLKVDPDVNASTEASSVAADATVESSDDRPKRGSRTVELLDGKLELDVYEHPLLGDPEAKYVVVEFFDYTCPHCRKMHKIVAEARPRYGDQLAIVMLPMPNDIRCNRYVKQGGQDHRGACKLANLAVATSDLDPATFEKLHDWMMKPEHAPSYGSSLSRASKTIDQGELLERLADKNVSDRVQGYIELFATLDRTYDASLPLQILGGEVVAGAPASAQELCDLWEQKLGIKPVK